MDPRNPTVAEVVRRAVEVCDPDGTDPDLGRLQEQLEDDDEPVRAVQNLEERLAIALGGVDHDGDPGELISLAAKAQWKGRPPEAAADWLAGR